MTYCPVNSLPDFVYFSVTFSGEEGIRELYAVRKRIREMFSGRKAFMETLAEELAIEYPDAVSASVRLMFNRHEVHVVNVKHRTADEFKRSMTE